MTNWKFGIVYLTTAIALSLEFIILGLMFLLLLNISRVSDLLQENVGLSIMLKEETQPADILQFQKELGTYSFVSSVRFITKEEAASEIKTEMGEDFVAFLGYNPLLSSIDLTLNPSHTLADSVKNIVKRLKSNKWVKDVFYQENMIEKMNSNVNKISLFLLIFAIVQLIVTAALMNYTLRMRIHSQRFIIRNMQLVGATNAYIRRPLVISLTSLALLAAAIATSILSIGYLIFSQTFEGLFQFTDIIWLMLLLSGFGVGGAILFTTSSVNHFLKANNKDLYQF